MSWKLFRCRSKLVQLQYKSDFDLVDGVPSQMAETLLHISCFHCGFGSLAAVEMKSWEVRRETSCRWLAQIAHWGAIHFTYGSRHEREYYRVPAFAANQWHVLSNNVAQCFCIVSTQAGRLFVVNKKIVFTWDEDSEHVAVLDYLFPRSFVTLPQWHPTNQLHNWSSISSNRPVIVCHKKILWKSPIPNTSFHALSLRCLPSCFIPILFHMLPSIPSLPDNHFSIKSSIVDVFHPASFWSPFPSPPRHIHRRLSYQDTNSHNMSTL